MPTTLVGFFPLFLLCFSFRLLESRGMSSLCPPLGPGQGPGEPSGLPCHRHVEDMGYRVLEKLLGSLPTLYACQEGIDPQRHRR